MIRASSVYAVLSVALLAGLAAFASSPPAVHPVEQHLKWYDGDSYVQVVHDPDRGVTCWVCRGYGISCLRDAPDGGAP